MMSLVLLIFFLPFFFLPFLPAGLFPRFSAVAPSRDRSSSSSELSMEAPLDAKLCMLCEDDTDKVSLLRPFILLPLVSELILTSLMELAEPTLCVELCMLILLLDALSIFPLECVEELLPLRGIFLECVEEVTDFFLLGGSWDRLCVDAAFKPLGPCDFFLLGGPCSDVDSFDPPPCKLRVGDRDLVLLFGVRTDLS